MENMTVLKLLFFIVLVYLIYQTSRNLFRAALNDRTDQSRMNPSSPEPRKKKKQGPGYRAPHEEVEDAKWEDIS